MRLRILGLAAERVPLWAPQCDLWCGLAGGGLGVTVCLLCLYCFLMDGWVCVGGARPFCASMAGLVDDPRGVASRLSGLLG